ncbi:MAG: NAD(P)/FAD-dependent oxidoreductase [Acutalibacteraceae bacterium]|nr:NAD(P)/FAD-dependent oxidoreductase [Acutalibacteraceae bacterium]
MTSTKIIVIGAGAAGLFCAGHCAMYGADVTIIEKNQRVGRKIMITGKGRCNVTNNCDSNTFIANVPTNGKFLYSAINSFGTDDVISFFESRGLPLKTERGNRVFPISDKAVDVVDSLHDFVKEYNCKIVNADVKSLIIEDNKIKGVRTTNNKELYCDKVIVATGGKSYPLTGSTGDGYIFARQAGHTIVPPKPSLVPIVSPDSLCKRLQGLALKNIALTVASKNDKSVLYSDFGEMLFTHFGLSGPVVLSSSAHLTNKRLEDYYISIDLKPALTEKQLDARVLRDFEMFINKDIQNSLNKLLPAKIIPVVIEKAEIPFDTKCNSITKEQRHRLVDVIKNFTVNISSFRPIEEAIITSGGVSTKEINPKTMESKLCNGLYFAGEVIDVDAYTGGFNLQIAFSTGYLAGISSACDY